MDINNHPDLKVNYLLSQSHRRAAVSVNHAFVTFSSPIASCFLRDLLISQCTLKHSFKVFPRFIRYEIATEYLKLNEDRGEITRMEHFD